MRIIIETDDFRPSLIPLWRTTWDVLKQKHPKLKVTVYVSAHYQEFTKDSIDNVEMSMGFLEWFEERKSWVSIVPHCFTHNKPPECLMSYDEQKKMIQKTLIALRHYVYKDQAEGCLGWKASFYRMNQDTIRALADSGFAYYNQWWNVHFLKASKRTIQPHMVIGTHTSSPEQKNPDNISNVFNELDAKLTFFDSQNLEYFFVRDLVMEAIR